MDSMLIEWLTSTPTLCCLLLSAFALIALIIGIKKKDAADGVIAFFALVGGFILLVFICTAFYFTVQIVHIALTA